MHSDELGHNLPGIYRDFYSIEEFISIREKTGLDLYGG
jgi:hypothetical protein